MIVAVVGEFWGNVALHYLQHSLHQTSHHRELGVQAEAVLVPQCDTGKDRGQRKRFRLRIYLQRQFNLILMSRYLLLINFKVLQ